MRYREIVYVPTSFARRETLPLSSTDKPAEPLFAMPMMRESYPFSAAVIHSPVSTLVMFCAPLSASVGMETLARAIVKARGWTALSSA